MSIMPQHKVLSIVVPTYNMEEYLSYCLDSLIIPDLTSIEVLVINDGSKDFSSDIAHEYAHRYPESFRVIDKDNGNYGSCINCGLKEATGKYIKIIDADDSVDTVNFASLVKFLTNTDVDLVISDFALVNNNRETTKRITYNLAIGQTLSFDSICTIPSFMNMQMHAVTYKCDNLRNLNYTQTEGISYTDQQWIFLPMTTIRSVKYFNCTVYKYLIGREGQSMDPAIKLRSISHLAKCALDMVSGYESKKDSIRSSHLKAYLYNRMIPLIKEIYVTSLVNYDNTFKTNLTTFDNELKNRSEEIYDLIGSNNVSAFLGFRYLNSWRRHQNCNIFIIKTLSRIYLLFLKLKNRNHA